MTNSAPIIIYEVGVKLEGKPSEYLKKLYDQSEMVWGFHKNLLNQSKYQSIYNKNLYMPVVEKTEQHIQLELCGVIDTSGYVEWSFLNVFMIHCHVLYPYFHLFFIEKLKMIYPDHLIICLTSSKELQLFLHNQSILDGINIQYVKFRQSLTFRILLKRFLPKINFAIEIRAVIVYFKLLLRYSKLRIFTKKKVAKHDSLWIISLGKDYFHGEGDNQMDFYYKHLVDNLKDKHCVTIITRDFWFKYTYLNYITIVDLIKALKISILTIFKMRKYMKLHWITYSYSMPSYILEYNLLYQLFKKAKPKALIYYDEVYLSGRRLSYLSNRLKIPSYGFQHAIDSEYHCVYHHFKMYKKIPQIFPQNFLIYGKYSEQVFSGHGYPKEKMIQIGFDRVYYPYKDKINVEQKKRTQKRLVFVSPPCMKQFSEIYPKLIQKFESISIRPHPSWGQCFTHDKHITKEMFNKTYPNVRVIDSKKETMAETLLTIDIVFATGPTTVLLDAILMQKQVILYMEENVLDTYNMEYWGVEVVHCLDSINASIDVNPMRLWDEVNIKTDINEVFLSL